jgi:hypothetical protein
MLCCRSSSDPSPEERERRLREGVIVTMEPILAGTAYWAPKAGPSNVLQPDRCQLPCFGSIVEINLDDPVVLVVGQSDNWPRPARR